jgi:hypothetical protein
MSHGRQSSTTRSGEQSRLRRALGVGFRRETYANLAYLLARFPLGIAYFTVLVTGISLGLGLVPLVVGVPILAGVVALGGYIGVVEAGLLRRLRGRTVSVDLADPSDLSITEYLSTVATDPRNYALLAFGFGSFVVGIQLFVAITVVFSLGLAFAVAPLVYWRPGVEYTLADVSGTVELGGLSVDAGSVAGAGVNTVPEALAASVVGIAVCLAGLHAVNLTAGLLGALTESLLGIASE